MNNHCSREGVSPAICLPFIKPSELWSRRRANPAERSPVVNINSIGGRWVQPNIGTDPRDFTLRVNPKSLEVHVVDAVSYKTDRNSARRHRFGDFDPQFYFMY